MERPLKEDYVLFCSNIIIYLYHTSMKGNFETIASPEQPSGAISPVREKYVINNVYSNTTTIAREKYRKH